MRGSSHPMPAVDDIAKRRGKDGESLRSEKKRSREDEFDGDLDLSSDIKGIISALQQIRDKAQKDGQKKNEETIMSVASEIKSMINDAKSKFEKERQIFLKALSKSSKEYESTLRNEYNEFQAAHQRFYNEKQPIYRHSNIYSKYEVDKEKLVSRYEQTRKKEKAALAELEKAFENKISNAEEALKKKKQDDKSFDVLRKSLGSFLHDDATDDDDDD